MDRRAAVASAALAIVVAVPLGAQRTREYVSPEKGFAVKIPKWLEPVPAKPGDEQLLMQFKGRRKSTHRDFRGEQELTLMVVRIPRGEGPTTGEKKKDDDGPDFKSFTEQRAENLNKGTTIEEFLEYRGFKHELWPNKKLPRRPILDDKGRPYEVREKSSSRGVKYGAIIRCYIVVDETETFGLVALGAGLNPFQREVEATLKSLKRVASDADARRSGDLEEDPYEGSQLRDIARRREIRSELVHGWRAYDTENYILVTNVRSNKLIDRMLVDLEIMRAAYLERFPPVEGANMDAVSTVRVCDGYADYLKYAGRDMDGTGGYWAFTEQELVLFNPEKRIPKARPWLRKVDSTAVLYHEAMHQYFHYSNRQLSPGSWFNEGYGEVFGGAKISRSRKKITKIEKNRFRMDLIRAETKKKKMLPELGELLAMSQGEFYGFEAMRNYAYGWAFCYFLEQQREKTGRSRNERWANLPDDYLKHLRAVTDEYRKKMPKDAPDDWITGYETRIQKEAIAKTLDGIDIEELQRAWVREVRRWR